jgi:hypothetical protein
MFGRDDNHDEIAAQEPQHDAVLGDNNGSVHPDDEHASPAFTASAPTNSDSPVTSLPTPTTDEPDDNAMSADEPDTTAPDTTAPTVPTASDRLDADHGENSDLISIKQSALKELSPLVGHLDQTPEEKFRTTMMMIQASDDQKLIPVAHEAAQKITDEKTKAQALLDIVNEINYFTQHNS